MKEIFAKQAALLISTLSKDGVVNLGYDNESVEWVDGFVERQRLREDENLAGGLTNIIGAYLGECIIHNYGGEWRSEADEGGETWGVFFDDGNAAFPFAKVHKQFLNGAEDSIYSFYRTIPVVFGR
ncbi:MAG TPA: hypothetical protein VF666_21195 [Pyrinomonadaceae bacterium]|jgi:hypothetical protein